jgi:hypothetical protein
MNGCVIFVFIYGDGQLVPSNRFFSDFGVALNDAWHEEGAAAEPCHNCDYEETRRYRHVDGCAFFLARLQPGLGFARCDTTPLSRIPSRVPTTTGPGTLNIGSS